MSPRGTIPIGGILASMSETTTYRVPAMHCGHCERAVTEEVSTVAGVTAVDVDLETKLVTVTGDLLDDAVLRAAIEEAGYEAA
jgi:copper chaperone